MVSVLGIQVLRIGIKKAKTIVSPPSPDPVQGQKSVELLDPSVGPPGPNSSQSDDGSSQSEEHARNSSVCPVYLTV